MIISLAKQESSILICFLNFHFSLYHISCENAYIHLEIKQLNKQIRIFVYENRQGNLWTRTLTLPLWDDDLFGTSNVP